MDSFDDLYQKAVEAAVNNKVEEELKNPQANEKYDKYQLDCLLNPEKQPLVLRISYCLCTN